MSAERDLRKLIGRVGQRILRALGVEVRSLRRIQNERRDREVQRWRVLKSHGFLTILDVGANEGQFASIARRLWPEACVHSFEPLPDVHATLAEKFRGDPKVRTHNIGLGAVQRVECMHRSAFSPSSSLLPMAQLHQNEWPHSAGNKIVEVRIERLDDWVSGFPGISPCLIKIDVQGYELSVIDGGADTIRQADIVVLEVCFRELYEGQALFGEIHDRMRELGFVYRGNVEQFFNKNHTAVLYADAIFENVNRGGRNF